MLALTELQRDFKSKKLTDIPSISSDVALIISQGIDVQKNYNVDFNWTSAWLEEQQVNRPSFRLQRCADVASIISQGIELIISQGIECAKEL